MTGVPRKTKQAGRWGVLSLGTGDLAALQVAVREGVRAFPAERVASAKALRLDYT